MNVVLLFDKKDMDDPVFKENTYCCGNHSLSTINVEGINGVHLSIENKKLYIKGNKGSELYHTGLDDDVNLIILSHWGHQGRACYRLFFNNEEEKYKEASLDPDFEGFWKRIHNKPKIFVCEGRFSGMNNIIQSFSSEDNNAIIKLEENLGNKDYEKD